MATIQKRESGGRTVYRAMVRLRGQPAASATFERLTDAKRWAAQTETEIREGRYFASAEAKRHTLAETIARYRKEKQAGASRQNSDELKPIRTDDTGRKEKLGGKTARDLLDWWENELGALMLSDITTARIAEARNKLKAEPVARGGKGNPKTDATVNRYLFALSAVFTAAVREWQWLEKNPVSFVKKGGESRGRVRFLSDDERARLLTACANSPTRELRIIVLLAICTGMRRGEIMALRWRDVDISRQTVTVEEAKNGERRTVPLAGPALDAMREWAKVRPLDGGALVFPGKHAATKERPVAFDNAWRKAVKQAELVDFRFHDLRHTAASYLAMNGAGLRELADILGHRTLAMVMRYSHLTESHRHAMVSRMTAAVFGEGGA